MPDRLNNYVPAVPLAVVFLLSSAGLVSLLANSWALWRSRG